MQAQKLETLIHRKLKKFRVANGRSQELFKCSLAVYLGVLDVLDEFIEANSPDMAAEAARQEREKQEREAREAQQRAHEEAQEHAKREREQREREAREREELASRQREREERERREREERRENKNVLRYAIPGVIGLFILFGIIANTTSPPARPAITQQTSPSAPTQRDLDDALKRARDAEGRLRQEQQRQHDAEQQRQRDEEEAQRREEEARQREAERAANMICQFSLRDGRSLKVRFTDKTPDGHIKLVEIMNDELHDPSDWRWSSVGATTTYTSQTQNVRIDVTGDIAKYLGRDPDGRHSVGGTGSCSIIAGGLSAG
jgi:hypothetical protein